MKYNPETVSFIVEKLKVGLTQRDASVLAGISEDTLSQWKHDYPEFAEKVRKARMHNKAKMIGIWQSAAEKRPELAVTWLERRYSDEFSPRFKQDVTFSEANRKQAEAVKKLVDEITRQEEGSSQETR